MKTIFVYGFKGYKKQSETAKRIFEDLVCFDYDSELIQPIEEIAEELEDFINSKTKNKEKINLIGISAGGIIADYYSKFISPGKVNKIATVCSPFGGSYISIFYSKSRKGLKELSYNSLFLKKLNSRKLGKSNIINFYSFFDILVPFNSGKGENPRHTWNFLHFIVHRDERILRKINDFFGK